MFFCSNQTTLGSQMSGRLSVFLLLSLNEKEKNIKDFFLTYCIRFFTHVCSIKKTLGLRIW